MGLGLGLEKVKLGYLSWWNEGEADATQVTRPYWNWPILVLVEAFGILGVFLVRRNIHASGIIVLAAFLFLLGAGLVLAGREAYILKPTGIAFRTRLAGRVEVISQT